MGHQLNQRFAVVFLALLIALSITGLAWAQDEPPPLEDDPLALDPAPIAAVPVIAYELPDGLAAADLPNDKGQTIKITWLSPKTNEIAKLAGTIEILRQAPGEDGFTVLGDAPAAVGQYTDVANPGNKDTKPHAVDDGVTYTYQARIKENPALVSGPVTAVAAPSWFHHGRFVALFFTIAYVLMVVFFIRYARTGKDLYVRPISGIDAVEEAVGRATEMGKPVLYVPGIGEIQEVATLAALTILSPIAEKVAEYDTPIIIPNRDPIVYTVAQEVVREAYTKAGRPDAYREDNIYFLSGRQFAYAAAVSGMMMRDKPATNFFFGMFYAESLILTETGAAIGSIQIAGTDQVAQLPFFIATCDYTLIGEELYAASAYLSGDPILVGSLKALDWMKVFLMAILGASLIGGMFGWTWLADTLGGGR
jgi:Domain of unknown function (DUF6754)